MRIDTETLRRVQAQKTLPVYPNPILADAGTMHYADAETENDGFLTADEVRRLALAGMVRNGARKAIESARVWTWRDTAEMVAVYGTGGLIAFGFGAVVAWAFVSWLWN